MVSLTEPHVQQFKNLVLPGLVILLLFLPAYISAQPADSTGSSAINKKRLAFVAIGTGTAYAGAMIGLSQVWYSQNGNQSFRFFNDAAEWKQLDKVGHVYSAFQISSLGSRILQWGKLPKTKADRIATIQSFLIMTSIEIFDGFSPAYGASATDIAANVAGAAFYLGQNLLWKEVRIYPKFSYHHTSLAALQPSLLGSGFSEELIKDYNGQTYWLSVDVDKFIRFPRWLNICVGYGAQNMVNARDYQNSSLGFHPYRQYYLGLDFDVTAFKSKSKVLNSIIYFVNMIRIPAPALEFSNGKFQAHGFYF
jgi:uncharacterized protein YfiM (DUF2279 family)